MEERRNNEEIRSMEAAVAKLCTDMEWVKLTLQRMETRVGCEDCTVSRDLGKAVEDRNDRIKVVSDKLDEHLKESRWTIDRIMLVITAVVVVIWEVVKAFASSGRGTP